MDLEKLAFPATNLKHVHAPRHRAGEYFLRGPIPMAWLNAAARASGAGAGIKVALVLWFLSGVKRQARTFKLEPGALRRIGVDRHAGYRGLQRLEKAGLVSVQRRAGQAPTVTLLEVPKP